MPRTLNPNSHPGWRRAVKQRDGNKCVLCGSIERIEVDHVKRYRLLPELMYCVDNGRCLCRECHKKTPTYGGKARLFKREDFDGAR